MIREISRGWSVEEGLVELEQLSEVIVQRVLLLCSSASLCLSPLSAPSQCLDTTSSQEAQHDLHILLHEVDSE